MSWRPVAAVHEINSFFLLGANEWNKLDNMVTNRPISMKKIQAELYKIYRENHFVYEGKWVRC